MYIYVYILGSIHLMLCLSSITSLYLLASLYHIVTWSKLFNHVKSCIHSWGHESLWRGDMPQCEMVRIYSKQLYLPYIPSFLTISLFQVMSWFSNLTYFAHFALNITPLISQYIQDIPWAPVNHLFISTPTSIQILFLPTTCCASVSISISAPTVLSSSAIRSYHEYLWSHAVFWYLVH